MNQKNSPFLLLTFVFVMAVSSMVSLFLIFQPKPNNNYDQQIQSLNEKYLEIDARISIVVIKSVIQEKNYVFNDNICIPNMKDNSLNLDTTKDQASVKLWIGRVIKGKCVSQNTLSYDAPKKKEELNKFAYEQFQHIKDKLPETSVLAKSCKDSDQCKVFDVY